MGIIQEWELFKDGNHSRMGIIQEWESFKNVFIRIAVF